MDGSYIELTNSLIIRLRNKRLRIKLIHTKGLRIKFIFNVNLLSYSN
jgi:hypothetical protein